MLDPLVETLGTATSSCLLLFVIGLLFAFIGLILGLARGWIVWGPTHNETVESERFFRGKTFEFAALAEARPRHE